MLDTRTQQLGSITLASVTTAVSCARMFVRCTLSSVDLNYLVDDAELVVSELVTNAVRASGPGGSRLPWADGRDIPLVRVRLALRDARLLVEVWDRDPRQPIPGPPTMDGEGGRGMHIVAELSVRWACRYPRGGGKVVWAELGVRSAQ